MTQKKSRTPSPTSFLMYQTPFNYDKVLEKFKSLDPIKAPLATKHSGNLIYALTDYFVEKPKEDVERILQIVILLNYIARHADDYSKEILLLEQLLYNFEFTFVDLVEYINSQPKKPVFYADVIDVINENFGLLKSSELLESFAMFKPKIAFEPPMPEGAHGPIHFNITNELPKYDGRGLPDLVMNVLDHDFEEFVINAYKHFDYVASKVYKDKISSHIQLERIITFMLGFPFVDLFSKDEQQKWYDVIASLAVSNNVPSTQADFIKFTAVFVSDLNTKTNTQYKLFLLDGLSKYLSVKGKIDLTSELAKVKTTRIKAKLLECNLIPNLCKHFQEQLNRIGNHEAIVITPEIMHSILHNPYIFNPKIVRDIMVVSKENMSLSESLTFFSPIYALMQKIQMMKENLKATPSQYHYCSITKAASIDNLHNEIQNMMNLSYFKSPWFDAPKTLHFKIVFESKHGMSGEFYCSLEYVGFGKYKWFDPYMFSQGVDLKEADALSIAEYISSKNVRNRTLWFVVTQYDNVCTHGEAVTFSWQKPASRRNPSPVTELVSQNKEEVITLPRAKSESNFKKPQL